MGKHIFIRVFHLLFRVCFEIQFLAKLNFVISGKLFDFEMEADIFIIKVLAVLLIRAPYYKQKGV